MTTPIINNAGQHVGFVMLSTSRGNSACANGSYYGCRFFDDAGQHFDTEQAAIDYVRGNPNPLFSQPQQPDPVQK